MPEGDTLYRIAVTLRKALVGRVVTRFESVVPQVRAVDARTPVAGRVVADVEARGKHLLITLRAPEVRGAASGDEPITQRESPNTSADLVLHTHLRMTGSWHIYRPGERWQKPEHYSRAVIQTEEFVAVCFSAPVVELLTAREAARHPDLVSLGPDVMTAEFDAAEALARLRRRAEVEIGVALLNQRLLAGVGNVYKSEVMFLKRVSPFVKVGELPEETLAALIAEAHRLMRLNDTRGERRTLFGLDQRERLWVYGRNGEPCRVCGETIRMRRQGMDARSTYYCRKCQGVGR